ncbi:MAG: hypothetical protein K0R75_448, partial [Paenibacillaceae bacterium]|nr:hypothetical protein [Paenibacillaceae bacterium]
TASRLTGEPLWRGTDSASEGSPAGGFAALVRRLDPRAKWLSYTLLSAGVLLQHSAAGLAAATFVTAAVVALTRTPWPRIARFAKPFAWFILISVLVAGIRFGSPQSIWPAGLSFSIGSAWNTFVQLYNLALIMALGVTLSETVPHAEFRRALDYVLTRLPVIRHFAQPISLAAELLLKFIPIIIGEVSRLTMAVKARRPFRQRGARKPIRPSELPALTVPLLLSVMQRADDLSTAMEHRGFSSDVANAASRTNLQFHLADYIAILIGVIWLIISIFLSTLIRS